MRRRDYLHRGNRIVDHREILRYQSLGYSQRQIEQTVHSSHHTVENTLKAAHENGITWPLDEDITNADLQEILFPEKYELMSFAQNRVTLSRCRPV